MLREELTKDSTPEDIVRLMVEGNRATEYVLGEMCMGYPTIAPSLLLALDEMNIRGHQILTVFQLAKCDFNSFVQLIIVRPQTMIDVMNEHAGPGDPITVMGNASENRSSFELTDYRRLYDGD
jgi:hypothetical protein